MFSKTSKILMTGASGLLGHALKARLDQDGYRNVAAISSRDVDLLSLDDTLKAFCETHQPEYVFHLAGAVYGIGGNLREPGRIFFENTLINTHVIEATRRANVKKIVAVGSICAYPTPGVPGPLREENLFMGEPHAAERAYGQAKRAMLAQLEAYRPSGLKFAYVISSNLYGPHDHFNLETGHVIPSLIRKFHESSLTGEPVVLWGDGTSRRDIVHSYDAANALIAAMQSVEGRMNLATGTMTPISEIAKVLSEISSVGSNFRYDTSKPKGHEFEAISIDTLQSTNFKPSFTVRSGLANVYEWYANNAEFARGKSRAKP